MALMKVHLMQCLSGVGGAPPVTACEKVCSDCVQLLGRPVEGAADAVLDRRGRQLGSQQRNVQRVHPHLRTALSESAP